MKPDTQHLDFLISQHVDGCLDTPGKRLVEQKLAADPMARDLYKDHRDTQDLLDDWGNRIPLIDWDQFDQKLSTKIEYETVGGHQTAMFRRWLRPLAAAAALFVAASVGYAWHAFSQEAVVPAAVPLALINTVTPQKSVQIVDNVSLTRPSAVRLIVEETGAQSASNVASHSTETAAVTISAPADVAAVQSLKESIAYGLQNVAEASRPQAVPSNSTVAVGIPSPKADDKQADPAIP